MARTLSRRPLVRTVRRKTSWSPGPLTVIGGQSISATGKVAATTAQTFLTDGTTMVRLRGEMLFYMKNATALDDGLEGAVGIAKVSSQSVAIGVTATPGPLAQEDWDGWLWHRYVHLNAAGPIVQSAVSIATDGINAISAALRVEIDGKAMRKFAENDSIVMISEWTINGTASIRWHARSRMLLKLP